MNDDKNSTPDSAASDDATTERTAHEQVASAGDATSAGDADTHSADVTTPSVGQAPPAHEAPTVPVAPFVDTPPAATAGAIQEPETSAPAVAPIGTKSTRNRALLIGGGIAAAILLAGGGIAVGAAIADDSDDDRPGISDSDDHGGQDEHGHSDGRGSDGQERDDDGQRGERGDSRTEGSNGTAATGVGSASADDIVAVADAARGVADGDVTAIDAKRDGAWEVELTTTAGAETEVRVDASLAATVISTDVADGDDTAPAHVLDESAIRALVAAALAEADGLITDLDADDDTTSPYDVTVTTTDGHWIDIDFSADFAVVGTDIDD